MVTKRLIPLRPLELTPEQKAAARAELQKRIDHAAVEGVYERWLAFEGKATWPMPYEEIRDKSDDRDRD